MIPLEDFLRKKLYAVSFDIVTFFLNFEIRLIKEEAEQTYWNSYSA